MILKFSFKIISTSLFFENFLLKELEENNLEGKLIKNKNQVDLFVKASQEELEEFADKLSKWWKNIQKKIMNCLLIPKEIFLFVQNV